MGCAGRPRATKNAASKHKQKQRDDAPRKPRGRPRKIRAVRSESEEPRAGGTPEVSLPPMEPPQPPASSQELTSLENWLKSGKATALKIESDGPGSLPSNPACISDNESDDKSPAEIASALDHGLSQEHVKSPVNISPAQRMILHHIGKGDRSLITGASGSNVPSPKDNDGVADSSVLDSHDILVPSSLSVETSGDSTASSSVPSSQSLHSDFSHPDTMTSSPPTSASNRGSSLLDGKPRGPASEEDMDSAFSSLDIGSCDPFRSSPPNSPPPRQTMASRNRSYVPRSASGYGSIGRSRTTSSSGAKTRGGRVSKKSPFVYAVPLGWRSDCEIGKRERPIAKRINRLCYSWVECQDFTVGVSNADFRKFRTKAEAMDWMAKYVEN